MEFQEIVSRGADDQRDQTAAGSTNPPNARKYHRHTLCQIQRLEEVFKESPHPDEKQRRALSRDLGLEPKQIKFWFQNKRTQTKAQIERTDNSVLRVENERIQSENDAIQEALNTVNCSNCGGPPVGQEERKRSLRELQLQNAQLKEENIRTFASKIIVLPITYKDIRTFVKVVLEPIPRSSKNILVPAIIRVKRHRIAGLFARYTGKKPSEIEKIISTIPRGSPLVLPVPLGSSLKMDNNGAIIFPNIYQIDGAMCLERAIMADTADGAMDELIKLLKLDEPLWIKSSSDGRFTLHRENYENIFPMRANIIKACNNSARFEASKHSGIVTMGAMHLVEMFLDSNKWVDIFPTIVTKEKTIQVLENGAEGNRHGSLMMIYEKMHILSPLVPSREFCFLRHCQLISEGTWVIADVSYDSSKESLFPTRCWRLPSGCMIQDLNNGFSKVTWVEHVHVDDKSQTHRIYRDLVCGNHNIAYGAERWILTLERMCERFFYFSKLPKTASFDDGFGRVISMAEGKRSLMNLSHRMVKSFCGTLNMTGRLDVPQIAENSGVRVSVRESTEIGQPTGKVVNAGTSFWLPHPPQTVFDFLKDDKTRFQWDVLSNGHPVSEIEHISTGTHPGNYVSILRPFVPTENNMLMLQESCIDPLGSLIVYAPIDLATLNIAITGQDSSQIPILASGFIISGDGRSTTARRRTPGAGSSSSPNSSGSLLTVAFQILISSKKTNPEYVTAVNTLISSTAQKIEASLNCSNDQI